MERHQGSIQTVVQGEASESEDEDAASGAHGPYGFSQLVKSEVVISGEASESDEEIDTSEVRAYLPTLKVDTGAMGDQNLSSALPSPVIQPVLEKKPKYNTLLHGKLRERNMEFAHHIRDAVSHTFKFATKELQGITQHLLKTQAVIQDVSHNMRILTNDLFHMEDMVDIITSCNLLPEIHISLSAEA